jgi:hypothetical protein
MKRQYWDNRRRQAKQWSVNGCGGSGESSGKPKVCEIDAVFSGGQVRFVYVYNEAVDRLLQKQELVEQWKAHLQSNTFLVSGYRFRFDDELEAFEHRNRKRLNFGSGARVFKGVKAEAQERFQMVVTRMCRAPFNMSYELGEGRNELVKVYSISFEWRGLLELDPESGQLH